MGTASIHEGVRRMRFSDLLDRTEAKEVTQEAASELLGIRACVQLSKIGEVDASEKISGELVVTCCDSAKVLQFVEESLDKIPLAVEGKVTRRRRLAVGFGRDHRDDFSLGESVAERIGVVCLVTD